MNKSTHEHATLMDNIYRKQRYVYDLTRKYYLFGRDTIIKEMQINPGDHVLEMGCGTARNLILLARKQPNAHYYGIDASSEMLITARQNVNRAGIGDRVFLEAVLAEEVDHQQTFNLDQQFDTIFFSYALSMIPTWRESLQTAMNNLKPGGYLYIVDFWDQAELPGWFSSLLKWWLSKFHVRHEPELLNYLQTMQDQCEGKIEIFSIGRRYAFWSRLQKKKEEWM